MSSELISVIVPSYNEEGNVAILAKSVQKVLTNINYEIIFIDDGSCDSTLENIKKIAKKDKRVTYLSFSRNFGHQNALRAGIDFAKGNCVISMDCDLQHPPELLIAMLEKWKEGYDVVYTVRDDKNTSKFKRLTSKMFYKIVNGLSDIKIDSGTADFRLLDRKVVDLIEKSEESNLFLRGFVSWVGFKQYPIMYLPNERLSGSSKYSIKKMFSLAIGGITSFSVKPLVLSVYLGFIFASFSGLYAIYSIVTYYTNSKIVSGWASVMISVLFIGGVQLIMLGILGSYLGKLFLETKKRPPYIVSDTNR